jgi:hypothetical protein
LAVDATNQLDGSGASIDYEVEVDSLDIKRPKRLRGDFMSFGDSFARHKTKYSRNVGVFYVK